MVVLVRYVLEPVADLQKRVMMFGFFGSYHQDVSWPTGMLPVAPVRRDYHHEAFCLTQFTQDKFLKDKLFVENERFFYAVEGVLFDDNASHLITWHEQEGLSCLQRLRGSFVGIIYDKQTDELIIYNDQVGSKLLYYTITETGVVFASDISALTAVLPQPKPDTAYINELLDYSYVSTDHSMVADIRRLCAGNYIRCRGNKVDICTYHRFKHRTPERQSRETIVANIDRLFRQAVQRVIDKNEAEGLKHYFPLSGGLDSRMAVWVATQMVHQPIDIFNYAQSGHYDHEVSKTIAKHLGHSHEFMPLDGGDYLAQIDEIAEASNYSIDYNGPAEIYTFLQRPHDWSHTGVVLTGVSGDIVLDTEVREKQDIARIYGLGFCCNMHVTPLMLQTVTESYSPYTDVDFLEYVLHIDHRLRYNYAIYDQWIKTCYPEAAQWHHEFQTIGKRRPMVFIGGRCMPLKDVPKRLIMYVLRQLRLYDAYQERAGLSMNPYDTWYRENTTLRTKLDAYFQTYLPLLDSLPEIKHRAKTQYTTGSMLQKSRVLTVLSAMRWIAHIG